MCGKNTTWKRKKKTGILMNSLLLTFFKHAYSQSKGKMNVCKINNSGAQISNNKYIGLQWKTYDKKRFSSISRSRTFHS